MGLIHKITFIPRFVRQMFYQPFNKLMFKSAGANIGRNFCVRNRFYLKLYKHASLTIGNDVRIGALVTILDTDCHSLNY